MIDIKGPVCVFFNRPEEFPRVCSISPPDFTWEICCKSVTLNGVVMSSHYLPEACYPFPKFWLQGRVQGHVDDKGVAQLWPIEERA